MLSRAQGRRQVAIDFHGDDALPAAAASRRVIAPCPGPISRKV